MITKKEFIEIIDRLKATDETIEKINELLTNCRDTVEADFTNGASLMVCHGDLVVKLLDNIFNTDTVTWWVYDMNYGKDFKIGYLSWVDEERS